MELFDIYNMNREKTGRIIPRSDKLKDGEYHIVVHICLVNSRGQMLVQQRWPSKRSWGNMWDISVGGSCISGETSAEGAHREVLEEIGLDINFSNIRPSLTVNFADGFDDIYVIPYDCEPFLLRLQDEEVQAVEWADKEDIFRMIDSGEFIPYHKALIELMFHFVNHCGTYTRDDDREKGRSLA
ncbi:MAG: NUDIX domain-containing protein [Oscillospiraceae bacterium]|nr:NUDIX domain-containing protein [Oscillospiraceae bacterium]